MALCVPRKTFYTLVISHRMTQIDYFHHRLIHNTFKLRFLWRRLILGANEPLHSILRSQSHHGLHL